MSPFLRPAAEGTYIQIHLQPKASRNEIVGLSGSELKIKVTAPPVDSAANEALVRFLAERLDCPKSAVQLVKGHTSRHKLVFVRGAAPECLDAKLA